VTFTSYTQAEDEACQAAGDTGEAQCVLQNLDDDTFQMVTEPEAERFCEDADRYEVVYTARPVLPEN
jgi:hypothetical protein